MAEVETRIVHFKVEPWLQAYFEWARRPANPDIQMDMLDAFHAGWEAGRASDAD